MISNVSYPATRQGRPRVSALLRSWTGVLFAILTGFGALAPGLHAAPIEVRIAPQGTNLLLSWPTNYSAFDLQSSTNLSSTNWTVVAGAVLQTNHFEVLESIVSTNRYYRLHSPCASNAAPYLPAGTFVTLNGSSITSTNLTNSLSVPALTFNASAFVDPSSCLGNGSLSYAWLVTFGGVPVETNISGQSAATLVIATNTLTAGVYSLALTVTGSSGLATTWALAVTLTNPPAGCDLAPAHREYGLGFSTDRPYLPEGGNFVINNIPLNIDAYNVSTVLNVPATHQLYIDPTFPFSTQFDPYSFIDASAVIDPATCDNSGLSYTWVVDHETLGADLHPYGVSGYNTSRLQVAAEALPNGLYHIHLFVTGAQGTSEFILDFEVQDSNASFLSPCHTNTVPFLPQGSFVTMNGGAIPASYQFNPGATSIVFNASAFVEPFACDPANLSYDWQLASNSPSAFIGGVGATSSSIFTIPTSSLSAGHYIFRLTVGDLYSGYVSPFQMDIPLTFTSTP